MSGPATDKNPTADDWAQATYRKSGKLTPDSNFESATISQKLWRRIDPSGVVSQLPDYYVNSADGNRYAQADINWAIAQRIRETRAGGYNLLMRAQFKTAGTGPVNFKLSFRPFVYPNPYESGCEPQHSDNGHSWATYTYSSAWQTVVNYNAYSTLGASTFEQIPLQSAFVTSGAGGGVDTEIKVANGAGQMIWVDNFYAGN